MLRKNIEKHEKEDREKHVDLSMVNIRLLTATVSKSEEKHRSLEKTIAALKDKQHKDLAQQQNKLSKINEKLTRHDTLAEKNANLSKKHKQISEQIVRLHQEQQKIQARKEEFTFKLPGYASKKKENEIFFSTPFYSHPGGYKMSVCIDANGNGDGKDSHISVFTKILAGCYNNELHWPFMGTVTCELLNQLRDDNHRTMVNTLSLRDNTKVDCFTCCNKFLPHCCLGHNPATNTQYLLKDTLYFRVSVKVDGHKPWLVCTDYNSIRLTESTEAVIFRITEYSRLIARKLQVKSDSFYTSSGGYYMCININGNGSCGGKGTHVSVATELLKGHYDSQLHWPFRGTVKVELLNQLGDNNHHNVTITCSVSDNMRVGSSKGCFYFLPHSSLSHNLATNTQYLLNDTLYFRVSVKVDDHKPWLVCTQPLNKLAFKL